MLDDAEVQALIEEVSAPDALAAEEYQEAWQPTELSDDWGKEERPAAEGSGTSSSTPAAASAVLAAERRIATAKNQEERDALARDTDVARFTFAFSGDEARLVKGVLGDEPARRLVELCKARQTEAASDAGDPAD